MRLTELEVPAADAELAADRLWAAGAGAVEELDGDHGTVVVRAALAVDDRTSRARLGELPAGWVLRGVDVPDEPLDTWRSFARPIEIDGGIVIRPAWLDPVDDGRLEIAIEPGASFGLGDHPTTRLSAAAVARLVRPGDRVLDVGCGSGVLGIISASCGASAVTAIDVAEAAVEATLDNAARNGVAALVHASATPVADVDGEFEVVVANLLAPIVVAMADDLRRLLAPDGTLVVSGILADRHDHVVDALAPLCVTRTDQLDAWAAIELRQPASSASIASAVG